jgi:hypothetical protein
LIFNFDKGTIQKVEKSRNINSDTVTKYLNYIKGFPTKQTITGDFNGNGKQDTLMVGDIHYGNENYDEINYFHFVFSDKTIPKLKIEYSNLNYTIKNEGDLDGDGRDEIGFLYGWSSSGCRYYNVFTLKNNKWETLIEPVFLTEPIRVMGVLPIEKDPEQEGVILIRLIDEMTCCACMPFYVVEKSLKIK